MKILIFLVYYYDYIVFIYYIMNKFTNCIYILDHYNAFIYNKKKSIKIGSSKSLPMRLLNYKTYYPININVICYFYIENYDCYKLDDDIKREFNNNRIKDSGGIEYYQDINYKNLINYFNLKNIKFIIYFDNDYNDLTYLYNDELILNYNKEVLYQANKLTTKKIILKIWQNELVNNFNSFLINNELKAGMVIAPTGCGKSFMIRYLIIFCYILKYKNDVIIMNKRKEIFDKTFIDNSLDIINYYNLDIDIIDLINDDILDHNIFINKTNKNRIYIINNDKFVASSRYSDYENYSFGNIKLLILDECHSSGSELFNKFLLYMKNNIVDKIVGFSATPVRIAHENKFRTLDIFRDRNNNFSILYIRDYLKAIEEKERLPNKWLFIPIKTEHLIDENVEDIKILNKEGINECLKWLNNFIVRSIYKKGIIWFSSKKSLKEFYDNLNNLSQYYNLANITFYKTFSKIEKSEENTDNNIELFKNKKENSILLAVMRATEGFDDPTIDFAFNFYVSNSINPLLDQQKEGRVARLYENKTVGYYGFIINTEIDYQTILIKRLGNWINYINELNNNQRLSNEKSSNEESSNDKLNDIYNYINQFIDIDSVKEINLKDIREKIIIYNDNLNCYSELVKIKKHMHLINKMRLKDNIELIDTESKYKIYAEQNGLNINLDLKDYSYNWIKFLRDDYDELTKLYYTVEELQKLNINNFDNFILKQQNDIKIPSLELINNGFYNDNTKHFNLSSLYIIKNKKKF